MSKKIVSKGLISIVIPVYNSEKTIGMVVNQTKKALSGKIEYEIILVNDGSDDGSFKKCKELSKEYDFVKFINLSKNFGQHNAILAGLHYVDGDFIVFMDDDMQTPAEAIWKLLEKLNEGYDAVYANYIHKHHNWFRNLGTKIKNLVADIALNKPKDVQITSFFIINRFLADEIIKYTGPYSYLSGLVLRTTNNVGNIYIQHQKRRYGRSNYNLKRLLGLGLNEVTSFSVIPLRVSFFIGIFCSVIGLIFSIIFIVRKIIHPEFVLGWTSTIVAILFFSGVLLIMGGLIGEYVGRIFLSINKHPQFVIKNKYNIDDKN